MNIIIQNSNNVNINVNCLDKKRDINNYKRKWASKKQESKKMADKFITMGMENRGYRMYQCSEDVIFDYCQDCGTKQLVYANLCRDRFCPLCAWRLSMKRFSNMVDVVNGLRERYPEYGWSFDTLTCKNCKPSELKDTMDEMARSWNSVMSNRESKRLIAGTARSVELTYNEGTREVHPHYHILTMWKGKPSMHLVNMWLKSTRLNLSPIAQDHTEIRAEEMKDGKDSMVEPLLETYKYAFKAQELERMPLEDLAEVVRALRGRRLMSLTGLIKSYAKEIEADNMDSPDENEATNLVCHHCGSKKLAEIVGKWSGTNYIWRK